GWAGGGGGGGGYRGGSGGGDLPLAAWLLATADCYRAMREPRPYREALTARAAAEELSREAEAGLLPPDAVHAVLTAAGQPRAPVAPPGEELAGQRGREDPASGAADRRQPGEHQAAGRAPAGRAAGPRPAGLSERECEVLGLLARGLATKQVARRLGISPKTCDHHIQRLYGKAGVSTRAGATLFALEHGLVH